MIFRTQFEEKEIKNYSQFRFKNYFALDFLAKYL